MLSRSDSIRQVLAGMEPQDDASPPVSFSGSVSQVNIISHATITIDAVHVLSEKPFVDHGDKLAELVHTLAVLESATSSRTIPPEAVWKRVKEKLNLPVNKPIPVSRQQDAIDELVYRLALARGDLQRDPEIARKRSCCYRRCHAIARQHGLYADMRQHMDELWGAKSMRDLQDEALWSLETYMRKRKTDQAEQETIMISRLRPLPKHS